MSARTGDDTEYQTVGTGATELQRYAAIRLETGEAVVYDTRNEDAWIQSDSAVGLAVMP